MEQDKNFTVRLKAAVEKRLRETGVIKQSILPASKGDSDERLKLWQFIQSLESITLEDLQGSKK